MSLTATAGAPQITHLVGDDCPGGHAWEHGAGDDDDGCLACWNDQYEQGAEPENITACSTPEPDPLERGLCRWCSHAIEPASEP